MSGILWIVIVGLVAGFIARMLAPGPNNPQGFILTCILGVAGSFLTRAAKSDARRESVEIVIALSDLGLSMIVRKPLRKFRTMVYANRLQHKKSKC